MSAFKRKLSEYVRSVGGSTVAQKKGKSEIDKAKRKSTDKSIVLVKGSLDAGRIYTFLYPNPKDKSKLWDANPTILYLGKKFGLDVGINLNLLPGNMKLDVIDAIYDRYSSVIEKNIKRHDGNANKESGLGISYDSIKQMFGNGIDKYIRSYFPNKRVETYVISYTKWEMVAA